MVCLRSRGPPGGPRRPREGPRIAQGDLPGPPDSAVHWRGGNENSRIWSFHLDTLRVPKLVPHPALQPGAEVVDPSQGKRRFSRVPGGWNPALRSRILKVFRAKAEGQISESENSNGPLSELQGPRQLLRIRPGNIDLGPNPPPSRTKPKLTAKTGPEAGAGS